MPISLDPKAVFRVVLEVDEGKSPQPAFLYRHLSALDSRQTREAIKAQPDRWEQVRLGLLTGLVGWEHLIDPANGQPIAFDAEKIFEICTDQELGEILAKVAAARSMTADDRKKSGSPLPSEAENSAAAAAGSSRDAGGQQSKG
jgi:hypothetical protein